MKTAGNTVAVTDPKLTTSLIGSVKATAVALE